MPSNQIKSRTGKCININYASKVQLLKIPGMKSWLVEVILLVRKNRGCITKEMLQVLANGQLPSQSYATMDFTLKEGLYNNKTIHGQSSTSQNKTFSQKYSVNGEIMKEKRVVTMLTKMFQFIFQTVVVQTRRGMPAQKRRLAKCQTLVILQVNRGLHSSRKVGNHRGGENVQ